ncbi:MAG TPA: FAD:protein FMN transferase [Solibacterales bacterium]|nr:FAD:protein FMN transferase [Bryobacterales bacterium]
MSDGVAKKTGFSKHRVILLFLAPLLSAASAVPAQPAVRVERSLDAMGTTYTIALYGEDRFVLDSAIDDAFEEAQRIDRLISNYRQDSEWSRINREAAAGAVKVSEESFRLLEACLGYSRRSEGTFDITVGPLMKIWGFYKGTGRFPHRAEMRVAMARVGYRNIQLDPEASTVRFARSGVEIDPGGIGKGYAVDRMAGVLRTRGVKSGLISAGSSSIYAIGTPPGDPGWKVSVRHPKDPRRTVHDFLLKDESMSTSGNYEKFFWSGGKLYSHIMDPRTGYPAQGMLSASVLAPNTLDSEAWAKPFFILGRGWTAAHKPKQFRVYLCEDKSEPACALLP